MYTRGCEEKNQDKRVENLRYDTLRLYAPVFNRIIGRNCGDFTHIEYANTIYVVINYTNTARRMKRTCVGHHNSLYD